MFCTSCNADIGIRSPRFCPQCGAPQQATPAPDASAPDGDSIIPTHEASETPQGPGDVIPPIPDNSPTIRLPAPALTALLADVAPPDDSTNVHMAATEILSGGKTNRSKKKRGKEPDHARFYAQEPIEPFIAEHTTPDEPVPPLVIEPFSPVSLEESDRLVVEPRYPEPTPFVREKTNPAIFVLAAIILILFLGGLWWWHARETGHPPKNIDAPPPTQSSDPLPEVEPSPTPPPPENTPVPAPENTPAPGPEEPEPEPGAEPGSEQGLINIPSLPANQQQGRHNQYNPNPVAGTKDDNPPSVSPYPLPMPTPPAPAPARKQAIAVPPEPAETPRSSETATPPWLEQMRDDLSNCESFFCREKVRRQYCTGQWETLSECRRGSL